MPQKPRILIVDDDPIVADSLADFLADEGYGTATAGDGDEAMAMLTGEQPTPGMNGAEEENGPGHDDPSQGFAVVITDLNMPRCNGIELLKRIQKQNLSVVPVVVTGFAKIASAVEAIKRGAADYLTKPVIDEELRVAVEKALRQHQLLAENHHLRNQLTQRYGMDNIVGSDYRMQRVYDLVQAVGASKTTVLLQGESGSGKSLIAHAVHTQSPRKAGPFITFACGSIPETLLESELFGHVKGAFTGADADKPGKILSADGGTLFIDEINSATPSLQLKLLRVLQEKQFEPVGSSTTVKVDVRFVLATNQPLEGLVQKGEFREDLYYRINVVNIKLPALRERQGDIAMLADHFIEKYCKETGKTVTGFTADAMDALRRYSWPGNVRELENAIERGVVLCRRPVLDVEDLPETLQALVQDGDRAAMKLTPHGGLNPASQSGAGGGAVNDNAVIPAIAGGWSPMPLADAMLEPEKRILKAALEANDWNRQKTAAELNINRTTLYKKIKQFGLDEPESLAG